MADGGTAGQGDDAPDRSDRAFPAAAGAAWAAARSSGPARPGSVPAASTGSRGSCRTGAGLPGRPWWRRGRGPAPAVPVIRFVGRDAAPRGTDLGRRGQGAPVRARPAPAGTRPAGHRARRPRSGGAGQARASGRPEPALRLTRRGRVVVVALASAFLGLVFSLVLVTASQAFTGERESYGTHVVRSGETLWEIARDRAPEADLRTVIRQIMALNNLESAALVPGQALRLP